MMAPISGRLNDVTPAGGQYYSKVVRCLRIPSGLTVQGGLDGLPESKIIDDCTRIRVLKVYDAV
jgi:hypothetical protein